MQNNYSTNYYQPALQIQQSYPIQQTILYSKTSINPSQQLFFEQNIIKEFECSYLNHNNIKKADLAMTLLKDGFNILSTQQRYSIFGDNSSPQFVGPYQSDLLRLETSDLSKSEETLLDFCKNTSYNFNQNKMEELIKSSFQKIREVKSNYLKNNPQNLQNKETDATEIAKFEFEKIQNQINNPYEYLQIQSLNQTSLDRTLYGEEFKQTLATTLTLPIPDLPNSTVRLDICSIEDQNLINLFSSQYLTTNPICENDINILKSGLGFRVNKSHTNSTNIQQDFDYMEFFCKNNFQQNDSIKARMMILIETSRRNLLKSSDFKTVRIR